MANNEAVREAPVLGPQQNISINSSSVLTIIWYVLQQSPIEICQIRKPTKLFKIPLYLEKRMQDNYKKVFSVYYCIENVLCTTNGNSLIHNIKFYKLIAM